jgi:tetratricopeptide (TPR) repeat protein
MEKSRLELLEESLLTNPDAPFVRYALAMELSNKDSQEEAWPHFEYLLTRHPEYSATYFQAGKLLVKLGRPEEAREILAKGIEVTARQGNAHAQSELQAALDELRAGGRSQGS